MKRAGHLLEGIAEPENLREAFLLASRAKSGRSDVLTYRENLTEHLGTLREQILTESVPYPDGKRALWWVSPISSV